MRNAAKPPPDDMTLVAKVYMETYPSVMERVPVFLAHLTRAAIMFGVELRVVKDHESIKLSSLDLTLAERRLATFIVEGGKLNDFARENKLSPHTVRNQLQSVFAKAGVNRQVDLVRKFANGAS